MPLPVTYATVQDIYRQVPSFGSMSNLTSAQVYSFLGEAEAVINAKLSARYTVPVSPTPPLLQVVATDLACYRIMRRSFSDEKVNKSGWPDKFSETGSLLAAICMGEIALVNSAGAQVDALSTSGIWSNNARYVPTFDVGDPFHQEVSPDHQTDLDNARL